jgi:protein ImuB
MIALPLPFPAEPTSQRPARPLREVTRTDATLAPARPATRRRTIWLAVHLPDWPLHAALSALSAEARATLETQPLVIVDDDRRGTIVTCNDVAASRGIRPGHSLNACIALCADTQFLPRHPVRERQLLDEIALLAQRYTSSVSVQPPNELLLEIRGSLRLFGGITALVDRMRNDLLQRGLRSQLIVSATAQSAMWLARAARESRSVQPRDLLAHLSRLPIAALLWPAEIELRLTRFGVLTVGDLLRLPRGGLARRIGYERLAELDRATGRQPEVRRDFVAPKHYEDRVPLEFEIETTGLLSVILERRLQRLQKFLSRRNLAIELLQIDLKHRDHEITSVALGLAQATADMAHAAQLLREQLAHVQLPAPVTSLSIRVSKLHAANGSTGDLLLSKGQTLDTLAAQARLLERLQSRLGRNAIRSLQARADHRAEFAQSTPEATVEAVAPIKPSPIESPRPLWLLAKPRPLRPNKTMMAEGNLIGPEKIDAGWWDEQLVCRDYFRARSVAGALGWIFRDRDHQGAWHLHGLFG